MREIGMHLLWDGTHSIPFCPYGIDFTVYFEYSLYPMRGEWSIPILFWKTNDLIYHFLVQSIIVILKSLIVRYLEVLSYK